MRLAKPFGNTIGVDLKLKISSSVCLTPRGPVAGFKVAYSFFAKSDLEFLHHKKVRRTIKSDC